MSALKNVISMVVRIALGVALIICAPAEDQLYTIASGFAIFLATSLFWYVFIILGYIAFFEDNLFLRFIGAIVGAGIVAMIFPALGQLDMFKDQALQMIITIIISSIIIVVETIVIIVKIRSGE